jgi:hypothetical protein
MINLHQLKFGEDLVFLVKDKIWVAPKSYQNNQLTFELRDGSLSIKDASWYVNPDGTGHDGQPLVLPLLNWKENQLKKFQESWDKCCYIYNTGTVCSRPLTAACDKQRQLCFIHSILRCVGCGRSSVIKACTSCSKPVCIRCPHALSICQARMKKLRGQ